MIGLLLVRSFAPKIDKTLPDLVCPIKGHASILGPRIETKRTALVVEVSRHLVFQSLRLTANGEELTPLSKHKAPFGGPHKLYCVFSLLEEHVVPSNR